MTRKNLVLLLVATVVGLPSVSGLYAHRVAEKEPTATVHAATLTIPTKKSTTLKTSSIEVPTLTPTLTQTPVAPYPRVAPLLPIIDQQDILPNQKIILDEILRMVPADCRDNLENFYVSYKPMKSRGYAGATTVILDGNLPANEFRGVAIHEILGHFMDISCMRGTPESGASNFKDGTDTVFLNDASRSFYEISWEKENLKKQGADNADFVTGYASSDAFEDLAETIAYYVLAQETFKARASTNAALAAKLQWIETYIFPNGSGLAKEGEKKEKKIPWDATKLAYTWHTEK
jgi:hypothetical protein